MEFECTGPVVEWRGPAPFFFVRLPEDVCAEISELAPQFTYGWGVIPVVAVIGRTRFSTSLFPRDDVYLLPLKVAVRRAEGIDGSGPVALSFTLGTSSR